MSTFLTTHAIAGGAALFFVVLLFGKFRLPALLRYYALSSLCIAALAWVLRSASEGVAGAEHMWIIALGTLIVKVCFIPWVIAFAAKRAKALMRLQTYIRPAPSYFVAIGILVLTLVIAVRTPLVFNVQLDALLYVSLSMVLLGLGFMIMRRDLFSQIVGFLVLENGISIFGMVTVGSIPLLIELGLFNIIVISAVLMAMLSTRVQELYGSEDTEKLRELID